MDLSLLRQKIDAIDNQLIPLLLERMSVSKEIAAYKEAHGLPVLDEKREQEILDSIARRCGEEGDAVAAVYAALMGASRAVQQRMIDGEAEGNQP